MAELLLVEEGALFRMTGYWQLGSWKLALASSFFLCGALALGGGLSPIAPSGDCAFAQITPDTTLGSESSTVTSTGSVDQINGGAARGANLFHSFGEFNVESGRAAVFTNPAGIENILTRVTGGNPSNIFGTLGVSGGNANLFLINPNGIIFGLNARLDVGESFVGTTANAIKLTNGGTFSANSGGRCCRAVDVLFFTKKNSIISLIDSRYDFPSASVSLLPGY